MYINSSMKGKITNKKKDISSIFHHKSIRKGCFKIITNLNMRLGFVKNKYNLEIVVKVWKLHFWGIRNIWKNYFLQIYICSINSHTVLWCHVIQWLPTKNWIKILFIYLSIIYLYSKLKWINYNFVFINNFNNNKIKLK